MEPKLLHTGDRRYGILFQKTQKMRNLLILLKKNLKTGIMICVHMCRIGKTYV